MPRSRFSHEMKTVRMFVSPGGKNTASFALTIFALKISPFMVPLETVRFRHVKKNTLVQNQQLQKV